MRWPFTPTLLLFTGLNSFYGPVALVSWPLWFWRFPAPRSTASCDDVAPPAIMRR